MSDLTVKVFLPNEARTIELGKQIAPTLTSGGVLYLHGELGTGKTTLVRGVLQGLGYQGRVKSPTYTLVEPYEIADTRVFHFDLYRLGNPEELEFMGIRDYFSDQALLLVEWPERGQSVLPAPDMDITLAYRDSGREFSATGHSSRAANCLNALRSIT